MVPTPAPAGIAAHDDLGDEADGRRLRAARNREAVVVAVLDIIRQQNGGPIPGAAEVALRAGVSERTVFRHFADLETLFFAAAQHQRPIIAGYLTPRPDQKELDKRITALVRLRSRMYEDIGAVRRVAMRLVAAHPSLAVAITEASKAERQQVADTFERELAKAGPKRPALLDQLDLVTGWSSWEHLRTQQGYSAERARRVMSDLVTAVLSPYAGRRGR